MRTRSCSSRSTGTPLNGICRPPEVVYLATDLRPIPRGSDGERDHRAEEGISAVARVPLPDVLDMVRRGEITDGKTVAALMYALLEIGQVG